MYFIVMYVLYSVSLCCSIYCLCVNVYCTVLLPPGVNPIAVNNIYIYMNIYEYQHEYLRNTFVLVIGLTSRELAVNNKTERTIQY